MKKFISGIGCCLLFAGLFAQNISPKLQKAFTQFENDPQLKHAISSLYVIDAKAGKVVFDKNSGVGLAPASTQKIITAATAFELLGKDYRYKTELGYDKIVDNGVLRGNLYLLGYGDPTYGSRRYSNTTSDYIFSEIQTALKKLEITKISGSIETNNNFFETGQIPPGWIWEDLGNYYGAGSGALNWKENQYDITLKPGEKTGDSASIINIFPAQSRKIANEVKTGSKNSGDNAFIYFSPSQPLIFIKGTIPCCVDSFVISGSVPNGSSYAIGQLSDFFVKNNFQSMPFSTSTSPSTTPVNQIKIIYTHFSPSLDSVIYWFLKKSINLYGEALIKTMGYEKRGFGATDTGVNIVKDFWKQKGLDPDELNMYDGSGLSPLNRITTHAQVEVLKYARKQSWFPYFYDALPDYNGMKLKSGTISDAKGFCGYYTSKEGKEFIVSFLVNNYNGPSATLVNKMYRVLDILK